MMAADSLDHTAAAILPFPLREGAGGGGHTAAAHRTPQPPSATRRGERRTTGPANETDQ
jgi:hypothetical protein